MKTVALTEQAWPAPRLGELVQTLAVRRFHRRQAIEPDGATPSDQPLEIGVEALAAHFELEAQPISAPYNEVGPLLDKAAPAILRLPLPLSNQPQFLALLGTSKQRITVLSPDLVTHHVARAPVQETLCQGLAEPQAGEVDRLLEAVQLSPRRWSRARGALLREMLTEARLQGWLLRSAGGAQPIDQAREAGLVRYFLTFLGAHGLYAALWIGSWWLLGQGALQGRLDPGWLLAWGLMLLTLIPCRLLVTYAAGMLAIRAGALVKRRLLFGAFKLERQAVRAQGAGQLLGRVMESEALEQTALGGGFLTLTAAVELSLAGWVLTQGVGGWPHAGLLVAVMSLTVWIALRYYQRRREWTHARLELTSDLVERMVGYRTRLAQEDRDEWHTSEDKMLSQYLDRSSALDSRAVKLQALVPRGWLVIGFLGLTPSFVQGGHTVGTMAIAIGGVLLTFLAFRDLAEGFERLLAAGIAWERVKPFWRAAAQPEALGHPDFAMLPSAKPGSLLLQADELRFHHPARVEPALQNVTLQLNVGDQVLLEGVSGAGKSTLGLLLASTLRPDSGLLLLQGLDLATLGASAWRRQIAIAPQFHDNHVFMGTFAFNLLMGRDWPPRPEDLTEAEAVCRELGLGPLLERMPAGLQQVVGETGWQLSHGERSRLYIARALLQGAKLIILDESFAALDPHTLRQTLSYVLECAPTLLVIAHP